VARSSEEERQKLISHAKSKSVIRMWVEKKNKRVFVASITYNKGTILREGQWTERM
jgi:hypothetical protein